MRKKIDFHTFFLQNISLIILVIAFVGFSLVSKQFLTITNIFSLLHFAAPWIFLSSGLALVIMAHHIDISIGSIAFLASVIGLSLLVRYNFHPALALPMIVLVGVGAGLINGILVSKMKVNAFIVTLSAMMVLRGIGLQIVMGRAISVPPFLSKIGSLQVGPVYIDTIISLLFLAILHLLHTRTPFGRYIMAVGSDPEVSKRMGINVDKIVIFVFVLSGLFASLGGFMLVLQIGIVSLRMGIGMEFVALACVVIGGISLFGGEGSLIPGLLLGVYTLNVIESGLNYLGISPYLYPFIRGGLIFLAMYVDSLRRSSRFEGTKKLVKAEGKLS